MHHALHEFTHAGSKIFRTFRLLFRRPGVLTAEYWNGRRAVSIRPLRLHIIAAAIHLLAVSMGAYRADFIRVDGAAARPDKLTSLAAAGEGIGGAAAEDRINRQFQRIYGVAQYFAARFFALTPRLMFRKRRPYFIQHLIFALHVCAFRSIVSSAPGLAFAKLPRVRTPMSLITTAYLHLAVRSIYGGGVWSSLRKAILLRLGRVLAEFIGIAVSLGGAIAWAIAVAGKR
jgi:hypothetical protein